MIAERDQGRAMIDPGSDERIWSSLASPTPERRNHLRVDEITTSPYSLRIICARFRNSTMSTTSADALRQETAFVRSA